MLSLQQMKTQQSIKGTHSIIVPTSADLHKVIKTLQKMLKEQKQKKERAEQALQQFRERTLKRQGQFCTIIAKLKQYNSAIIKQNPEINRLFATIWANFDMFNKKSVQLLQQKYEDVVQHMTRKVDTIMKYTKSQLAQNNKKLNMDLQNIQQQIQQVYKIAINIEDKNIQMADMVRKLHFQLKVLKEEKTMIIQDAVQRKNQVKNLVSQNQRLNDQLLKLRIQLSNKQMVGQKEDKMESKQANNSEIKLLLSKRPQSKASQQAVEDKGKKMKDQMQLSKHKSQLYSFETVKMNHINRMETLQYMKDNRDTDKKQTFLNSTISFTPRSANTKLLSQKQKNTSTFVTNRRSSQMKSRRSSSIFGQVNDLIPIIQGITPNTLNQRTPQPIKASVGIQHYERTISHLQKCVKRQKQRSHNLMKLVNSLLSKSKQINETLERIFKQEQQSKDTNKLERIMKSQKLIQVLRILKQRLGALEKMDVNCGWGDVIAEI